MLVTEKTLVQLLEVLVMSLFAGAAAKTTPEKEEHTEPFVLDLSCYDIKLTCYIDN
jgi:hypothetical protein